MSEIGTIVKDDSPEGLQTVQLNPDTHVVISRAQLAVVLEKQTELLQIFEASTSIMLLLADLFGGKFPKSAKQALMAAPKIMKALNSTGGLLDKFGPLITTIQEKAPRFLSAEKQELFAQRFPQLKESDNG